MSNTPLDTGEIVRLYVDEEWSVRDIATRFGSAYGRIYNLLRARVVMRTSPRKEPRRAHEYLMVAETMRRRITCGDWPPGCKIVAQKDLAAIFDVHQQTIREAIAHLRQRGYLFTVRHRGTYVRPPQDWETNTAEKPPPTGPTGIAPSVNRTNSR